MTQATNEKIPRKQRFHPIPDAIASLREHGNPSSNPIKCDIVDVSESGCLLYFEQGAPNHKQVDLDLSTPTIQSLVSIQGSAKTRRESTRHLAIQFDVPTTDIKKICAAPKRFGTNDALAPPESFSRRHFELQQSLALREIEDLSSEKRRIKDCQTKLLITSLTVSLSGVSLIAGLDTNITTNTASSDSPANTIFFTCISLAIASINTISALLSSFKSAQLNRIDSYLAVVKSQLRDGTFYKGYAGWEDALANAKNCQQYRTSKVQNDINQAHDNAKKLRTTWSLKVHRLPFFAVTAGSFALMCLSSVALAAIYLYGTKHPDAGQLHNFIWSIGHVWAAILFSASSFLIYHLYSMYKGSLSWYAQYLTWEAIFKNDVPFHPIRLEEISK